MQRKQDNQRKSLENLAALVACGLLVSSEDIRTILLHLLEVGATVMTSTAGDKLIRSRLPAPKSELIVQTGWKVLGDDRRYMTTIHFLVAKEH